MLDILTPNGDGVVTQHLSVGKKLLAANFNVNALRTNATLRREEWLEFDDVVVKLARDRLGIADDLISRGLTKTLKNAMGTTILTWETQSDMRPAEVTMDAITRTRMDRMNYETASLPIPIIHHDFMLNARTLAASRNLGESLDTSMAAESALQVTEEIEDMVINGVSNFKFAGSQIYGYATHPNRNQLSLASAWTSSGFTGEEILADVQAMIALAHGDRMFGPYMLYVPTAYGLEIDNDYKANGDKTVRERILQLQGIDGIRTADKMTADNVLLVQMTSNVVDLVVGQQPAMVEWEEMGGLQMFFKVMAIMVPRIKVTQSNQSGIVHLS